MASFSKCARGVAAGLRAGGLRSYFFRASLSLVSVAHSVRVPILGSLGIGHELMRGSQRHLRAKGWESAHHEGAVAGIDLDVGLRETANGYCCCVVRTWPQEPEGPGREIIYVIGMKRYGCGVLSYFKREAG